MPEVINYSDQSLRRVLITLETSKSDAGNNWNVTVEFNAFTLGIYAIVFQFIGAGHIFESQRGITETSVMIESMKLGKWMVINGSYLEYSVTKFPIYPRIVLSREANKLATYRYSHDGSGKIEVDHSPLASLVVEESKLVRRAILHFLYPRDLTPTSVVGDQVNFPESVVFRELNSLQFSDLIGTEGGSIILTTKGRLFYEQQYGSNIGTVFIIAPCSPPPAATKKQPQLVSAHNQVLELYKDVCRRAGFAPRFQEHEEPQKNIYADIFDYIDTCEFVISDVTWDRPNCHIETGYALARGKSVLLFVESTYFKRSLKERMPFDLSIIKYQTYERAQDGLAHLRSSLQDRISVIQQRRQNSMVV